MNRWRSAVALPAILGLAASAYPDVKQDVYEDDDQAEVVFDETGEHPDDGIGDMESLSEFSEDGEAVDASELAAFEEDGDDIAEDVYGRFDADLNWTIEDEGWESWYESSPEIWNEDGEDEAGFWDL